MAWLRLTLAALCFSMLAAANGENMLNEMVDEIIYEQANMLVQKGLDKIKVPDLNERYTLPIFGGVRAEGNLTEVTFWNTSSVARMGDADEQDNKDGSMTFSIALGVKEAKAHFDLAYRLGFIHSKKDVLASCGKNSVYFQVTVKYEDEKHCNVSLDKVEIKDLGNFEFQIKPSTFMDRLEEHLMSFAMNKLATMIKKTVKSHLQPLINEYMKKIDVCSLIPS